MRVRGRIWKGSLVHGLGEWLVGVGRLEHERLEMVFVGFWHVDLDATQQDEPGTTTHTTVATDGVLDVTCGVQPCRLVLPRMGSTGLVGGALELDPLKISDPVHLNRCGTPTLLGDSLATPEVGVHDAQELVSHHLVRHVNERLVHATGTKQIRNLPCTCARCLVVLTRGS